jgi:hypothetical protein
MIKVDDVLIEHEVLDAHFSCDLAKCKGACCTYEGEYGAPVLEPEIVEIEKNLEAAKKYLDERSIKIIEQEGYLEYKPDGVYTKCIDNKDCVFVYYDNGVAKCAIEKAYHNGESSFRKPVSCHLYPLRVGNFGGDYVYYDKIKECKPGRIKGKQENIHLVDTVKEALIRRFGKEWTEKFIKQVKQY